LLGAGDPPTDEYSEREGREESGGDGCVVAFAVAEFGDMGLGIGLVLGFEAWWAFLSLLPDEPGLELSRPTPLASIWLRVREL
jgi:hypothetical protein